jgi:hypothetical protein
MSAHDFIVQRWKLDGTSAEPDELSAALVTCQEAVLADWDDLRVEMLRVFRSRSVREVCDAALGVEQAVQDRLWCAGGPGSAIGDAGYARRLWDAQWQAHRAVQAKTGFRKVAKDLQRRAAGDRLPLTVCCGHRLRRLPAAVLAYNAPDVLEHYGENIVPLGFGDGCGAIFPDSSEPRAPKLYCAACSEKAGRTLNAGLAKNALARLRASRKRR